MLINLCLACRRVNTPEALRCAACGAALDEVDTQPLPLDQHPRPPPPGALWLSDLIEPEPEPPPATRAVVRNPVITLRDVVPDRPATPAAPAPRPVAAEPVIAEADAAPVNEVEARRLERAQRRAEVRRARLRALADGHAASEPPPEVLVLHADTKERDGLCALLRRFGFVVHRADGADQACALATSRTLVAAFAGIDTATDDDPSLIDCRRLHERCRRSDGTAVLLVGVVATAGPVDQVRAELAGCDELIVMPTTRGSVARVFDLRGIALPADARRV